MRAAHLCAVHVAAGRPMGRPPRVPLSRALARPALTRSRIQLALELGERAEDLHRRRPGHKRVGFAAAPLARACPLWTTTASAEYSFCHIGSFD